MTRRRGTKPELIRSQVQIDSRVAWRRRDTRPELIRSPSTIPQLQFTCEAVSHDVTRRRDTLGLSWEVWKTRGVEADP